MTRSDYSPPTFVDVAQAQWGSPPAGAVALDAAHLNAMAQAIANSAPAEDIVVVGAGIDPTGVSPSTTALRALIQTAATQKRRLLFPPGTYLVDGNLVNGDVSGYVWEGVRSERGTNAEGAQPGYSAVRIIYRPADTTVPMVRCYSTSAPLTSLIGPFIHRNIHFDVGAAHGLVFGVQDPANPTVIAPASPATVTDGAGQRYVFAVKFEGCTILGTSANRTSTSGGVLTRTGQRLLSLTKCFESRLGDVSLVGGDIQVDTLGCDKPEFRNIRSQFGHLPFNLAGSGGFGVQYTFDNVQFEGWTFTPIRSNDVDLAVSNSRWEQNDGNPVGGARFPLTGTVAVTADSATLTFSRSMAGVLFPGLSLVELTDGTNVTTALVSAVSGATVTVDTSTLTITWSAAAATATRIHSYGPFHSGAYGATYVNCSPGAGTDCPALVWQVGRGSASLVNCLPVPGAYGKIAALPLGNRHGDNFNLQGAMQFVGCSPIIVPDPANPFVSVSGIRSGMGYAGDDAASRVQYGDLSEGELPLRRRWVFSPKQATGINLSSKTPIVRIAGEANTGQQEWAWFVRSGLDLRLHDLTLPSLAANSVRIRVRARTVTGTATLTLVYYGNGGGAGPSFPLTTQMSTFEAVVPMPAQWQGVRTSAGTVGFDISASNVYVAGVLVEEITPNDFGAFPRGVQTVTKSGPPTDADFPFTPGDGTVAVDTTNNRLYVRVNGVWRYAALT